MISVVLLAPYGDIKEEIEQAIQEYTPPEPIQTTVYAMNVDEATDATFQADVIIARGFSAAALRERLPGQLVVPLHTSAYDVIDAVSEAISRHGSRKVALVGLPGMFSVIECRSRILDAEIYSYQATDASRLPEVIGAAKADGCDCFVGGFSLAAACAKLGERSVLLRTGKPAVVGSLEEAIRLVQSTREQREKSLFFKTILDYTKEGVISLDGEGRVTSINSHAKRYLSLGDEDCLGRPADHVIPFAAKEVCAALAGGEPAENELRNLGGRMLAIDCVPMRRERRIVGCAVFLRSVDRLRNEESIIRQKIHARGQKARYRFSDIARRSDAVAHAIDRARVFAEVDSPVLIVGESGTGKELFAQGIHNESRRQNGPFVAVNCAALSESLLESELFGYSDGAFTGALKGGKEGLFEAAHGGTLFLDEISEIPIPFQSKLLRVLQENEVRRLGSQRVVSIDVRIVAATNRDLRELAEKDVFRLDLLFRLNVLSLRIPPLRQRPEDIMELFTLYTREYASKYGKRLGLITSRAKKALETHPWRGNVRELKNVAERICVLGRGDIIDVDAVRDALETELLDVPSHTESIQGGDGFRMEREALRQVLLRHDGNRGKTAAELGLDRSTLWRRMKKYRLS